MDATVYLQVKNQIRYTYLLITYTSCGVGSNELW